MTNAHSEARLEIRPSGEWSDDDYDVFDGDQNIGRIMLHPLEKRQLQLEERSDVFLIPLIMSILTMIMAVVSPSFADAVILSGLY